MKTIVSVFVVLFCLCLITSFAYADVTAKVISYEKEVVGDRVGIKVQTEYTYPDGTKKIGTTRYNYKNFSKDQVLSDIKQHCETITKYYINGNPEAMKQKEGKIIDSKIAEQDNLLLKDKITALTYTIKDVYDVDLDLTLNATGEIKDIYK